MLKLNWPRRKEKSTSEPLINGNFIRLEQPVEFLRWPGKRPAPEALLIWSLLKAGRVEEYLAHLEKIPQKKIIGKFLSIICSDSSGLPVIDDGELPPVIIGGISFDPIQNVQARMITKITLLYFVENAAKKLSVWNPIQSQWMEKYTQETKNYIQIIEAIIKQCQNTAHQDKVPGLYQSIELIKESNRQYRINW